MEMSTRNVICWRQPQLTWNFLEVGIYPALRSFFTPARFLAPAHDMPKGLLQFLIILAPSTMSSHDLSVRALPSFRLPERAEQLSTPGQFAQLISALQSAVY